ncbi:phosphoenolpyruvate synthase [Hydrogenispora ethanolica]|uniref:Rifampicin phosphotransferase n=1 Tax=Hydrogenispora ethanolica TaxID=1082276 RepID=A0A4R1SBZ0_HYDET|nr:rifamycin-inactivating phosphotransferase [Hydrogenispora ethanolica]TCL76949.1 phosphoenolpyruvate synthase [Hydrogenispora ethanolica]
MNQYVLYFPEIDRFSLPRVGGKGANLGELSHIPGIAVPPGFCVSTKAYTDFVSTGQDFAALLQSLAAVDPRSLEELKSAGERMRNYLLSLAIPAPIQQEIRAAWRQTGSDAAYAVRSSATAEDLPGASFAGQQDTFLNVKGEREVLDSVRRCWASLFTDRAIAYRRQNGFGHDQVQLSVVVQRMVFPEVSGIMFTADPVTGNRKIAAIDASFGLGEALVSGLVSADLYQVKADQLLKKQIARKTVAMTAKPEGGTARVAIAGPQQTAQALADPDILRLAGLGRSIEAHFGTAQDIEWCLAGRQFYILQSRPVTTLYPVPPVSDAQLHLFISIGHPQMMTDALKPLGISVLRTIVPAGKDSPQAESDLLQEAGGRLYLDLTPLLAYPRVRKVLPELLPVADELLGRSVQEFIGRPEFQAAPPPERKLDLALIQKAFPTAFGILKNILGHDQSRAIAELNRFSAGQLRANRDRLQAVSGPERITRIQEILASLLPVIAAKAIPYVGAAFLTYKLIETLSHRWLGDAAELRAISKSPPGNVTTEMGLALGDVADAVRSHPAVIEYLKQAADRTFWDGLKAVPGGAEVLPAFQDFFARYGMRGTGEIDLTRPRWREVPTSLVPSILSHIQSFQPGQHRHAFRAGKTEAELAAARLLNRLRETPAGFLKARRMKRLIETHRALIGAREHPKYFMVQNLDLIKQALLQEAAALVAGGVLEHPEDIFWLSLPEIKTAMETRRFDRSLIGVRREKFERDAKLSPPRAITSEGEIITVKPGAQAQPGALAGSPVSAGTVEGRARVILRLEEARMDKGDILVAPYTDPGWTPLFPLAAGLVTEVGGLMTHGSVVAREYGIPAVVGVDNATRRIRDGQRIRVDGTRGLVEILEPDPDPT